MFRERDKFFERMYAMVCHLDGCIVECGVGKGKSLRVLCGFGRPVYGFDSWRFPEPMAEDLQPGNVAWLLKGGFSICPPLTVIPENARLVPGYFEQTLPAFNLRPVCLANIDCDLFGSYQTALRYVWPWMVEGSVMVFDEYHERVKYPGAHKAVDEFLATVSHQLQEDTRWYAVKR